MPYGQRPPPQRQPPPQQRPPSKPSNRPPVELNVIRYPNLKVLILLYPLYEEMEFDIITAVIRRAGIPVTVAGRDMNAVVGSRGIKKLPETTLQQAMTKGPYDCICLIGGENAWRALSEDKEVGKVLRDQERAGRLVSAICTSPIALMNHGCFFGKKLTSYPMEIETRVRQGNKYKYMTDDVVEDGKLITSRGNYTSFHWALRTVERLTDLANATDAAGEMIVVYTNINTV